MVAYVMVVSLAKNICHNIDLIDKDDVMHMNDKQKRLIHHPDAV